MGLPFMEAFELQQTTADRSVGSGGKVQGMCQQLAGQLPNKAGHVAATGRA